MRSRTVDRTASGSASASWSSTAPSPGSGPSDDEGALPDGAAAGAAGPTEIVDASGSTIVPGMVDCHSHLTLPGGAHWIDRIDDPPERLLAVAEHNGRLHDEGRRPLGTGRRRAAGRRTPSMDACGR